MLNLYNATCMYDFRVDCSALGNQLFCSSLRRITSPTFSCTEFPVTLCGGLKPHGLFPVEVSMVIGVSLIQLTFVPFCWWDYMYGFLEAFHKWTHSILSGDVWWGSKENSFHTFTARQVEIWRCWGAILTMVLCL